MHRQTGAGRATMWIAIMATSATILVGFGWSIWSMFTMFQELTATGGTPA